MIVKIRIRYSAIFILLMFTNTIFSANLFNQNDTESLALHAIPYPQEVIKGDQDFHFKHELTIVLDKNVSATDKFTADELIRDLKSEMNITAKISAKGTYPSIVLTRVPKNKSLKNQGYELTSGKNELVIKAKDKEGLFYGTQTLLQIIQPTDDGFKVPGLTITDWPDITQRAIHYDTKHHQDNSAYVKKFIKDLSRYKVNILVWEWEDKFEYPSHPEIGAPGAFTMKEMQEFTRYAQQYHIQIVPLVQGLGHVSFILKWPQYKHLREIESSNWEFCPLKDGSYELLFDLWKDAIEATPGSEYVHIGSDETYELAACENCRSQSEKVGRSGLYLTFVNRAAKLLENTERKIMVWDTPMSWKVGPSPSKEIVPHKNLVLVEDYDLKIPNLANIKEARSLGYQVFAYDPNPGVVPLMVPYSFEIGEKDVSIGSLEKSFNFLTHAANTGLFDGMICTSWDDAGLHNQMWMMRFVNAASYSWNGKKPSLNQFRESFYLNYYGTSATEIDRLYSLMNQAAYYYFWTMERRVWHYGEIGKTRMPDLPRKYSLEYDPFWNTEYKEKVNEAEKFLAKMDSALLIIENNKKAGVKNEYDFELFRTTAELVKHTCKIYLDLSELENTIKEAHSNRFVDNQVSLDNLVKARQIVENILERRKMVYDELVSTYEKSRLTKGYSTNTKSYFWQADRARHFANRKPDMSYFIYDEQLLDMEGYLSKLKTYTEYFKENWMN